MIYKKNNFWEEYTPLLWQLKIPDLLRLWWFWLCWQLVESILGKLFNSLPIAYTHSPPSGVCLQFADNRWHLDNQLRQLSFGCQTTRPFWLRLHLCKLCYIFPTDKEESTCLKFLKILFQGSPAFRIFGESFDFFQQPNPAWWDNYNLYRKSQMEGSPYLLAKVWRCCHKCELHFVVFCRTWSMQPSFSIGFGFDAGFFRMEFPT